MHEVSKRLLKTYLNHRWLSFIVTICLFATIAFSVVWAIGCVPLPWIVPVRLLDRFLNLLFLPLLLVSLASIAGMLMAAIYQERQGKGLTTFWLFLASVLIAVASIASLFFITLAGTALCSNTPKNRAHAVEVAQQWAGLAPLPQSVRAVTTEVKGSAFTREIILTFEAEQEEIETWLERSPGTKDVIPRELASGVLEYSISPRGGAEFAQITLSADRQRVKVRVYWS